MSDWNDDNPCIDLSDDSDSEDYRYYGKYRNRYTDSEDRNDQYTDSEDRNYPVFGRNYPVFGQGNSVNTHTGYSFNTETSEHCVTIMKGLNDLRQTGEMCEKIIKVDGQQFPVHQVVLGLVSPYFRAMFTGSFNEREKQCIEIQDVSKDAFRVILDFIYGEELHLNEDNLLQVYNCSDMMCIDLVSKKCTNYLQTNHWHMKSKIAAYISAKRMGLTNIMKSTMNQICNNPIQEPYFVVEMPYEVVQEILKRKGVSLEVTVRAIIPWLEHDPNSRFAKFHELISQVPLEQWSIITLEKLIEVLGKVPLSDKASAKDRDALVKKIQSKVTFARQILCSFRKKLVCVTGTVQEIKIREFNFSTLDWMNHDHTRASSEGHEEVVCKPYSSPSKSFQNIVLWKDEMYVFGRENETVMAYNLKTRSTRSLTSIPKTRFGFCVVAYENTLIAVNRVKMELLKYDFYTDTWQEICMCEQLAGNVHAVLYNGSYLVFLH